jgi:hypothetical protein
MSLHYKQYKKLKKIINMKKSYKNKQQKIIKELFSLNIHKFYKSNLYKKNYTKIQGVYPKKYKDSLPRVYRPQAIGTK